MSGKATYGTLGNLFDSVFGETLACGRLEIETDGDDPFALGGWESFVPALGEVIWQAPETFNRDGVSHKNPFRCAIYRTIADRSIGFLRVPHYLYDATAAAHLAELIEPMEGAVDVLVLDQTNNPGGSMGRMYDLVATGGARRASWQGSARSLPRTISIHPRSNRKNFGSLPAMRPGPIGMGDWQRGITQWVCQPQFRHQPA